MQKLVAHKKKRYNKTARVRNIITAVAAIWCIWFFFTAIINPNSILDLIYNIFGFAWPETTIFFDFKTPNMELPHCPLWWEARIEDDLNAVMNAWSKIVAIALITAFAYAGLVWFFDLENDKNKDNKNENPTSQKSD